MTARRAAALGAVLGALGVAFGAFGAHALKTRLDPADLTTFETAVRYQLYHALALLGISAWMDRAPRTELRLAAWLMGIGVLVFSGSLYLLVATGQRWLGAVTPIGGVALIAGWAAVVLSSLDRRNPS